MNSAFRGGLTLAVCATLAMCVLGSVHLITHERVQAARQQWLRQALVELLPPGPHDADPLSSVRYRQVSALGGSQPVPIYTVHQHGSPHGAVIGLVTNEGYNGTISLMLGLQADGRIMGVRASEHRETPGLGDRIEIRRSDWIRRFDDRQLTAQGLTALPGADAFDGMSGATITANAVTRAVHRALQWYEAHGQTLFSDAIEQE